MLSEQKVEVEAEIVTSGDEIEQARQDLMRAAMEAIAMPAAQTESSVSKSSVEEDIPVIRVRINRPEPPVPEVEPAPETPATSTAPSVKKETVASKERPLVPIEPSLLDKKDLNLTKSDTALEELPKGVPVTSEPMVVETEERSGAKKTADRESVPEHMPDIDPELQETLLPHEDSEQEEAFDAEYALADSTGIETFPAEQELPREDIFEEQSIEKQQDIPEEEIHAVIFPQTDVLSSRVMAFAEAETEFPPAQISPEDVPLESPASEILPADVSFPAPPREQPAAASIAQLDDIMIDIVKQDIALHRRRISRSDGGNE